MTAKLKGLLFILVLGSVCTLILLGIKSYTLPKIELYHQMRLKTTILDAARISYTKDDFDDIFTQNIREVEEDKLVYYLSPKNLYIFKFEGRGLWGMIEGVIVLNSDLETIENIRIVAQEETPGLGGRIGEESFLSQFKKKKISPKLFLVSRRKADKVNEVDTISGASMTSQALIDMINEDVINFRNSIKRQ